jgi:hypothetical protein
MKAKYLIIALYIVLIGVFGFFYESKANTLNASPIKASYNNIDNYYDVDMPRYPNVDETPIIGEQYINNARAQSSYFITTDSPLEIADFYVEYWENQGLSPAKNITPEVGSVSVYDYKDHTTKTVTIRKETNKLYRVVLTAINDKRMKREFNAFTDIPYQEDSYGFVSYELEDDNYKASDVSYMNPHSILKNELFYKKAMPKKGWKLTAVHTLPKISVTKTLVFSKGYKVAEINLTKMSNDGTAIRLLVKDKNSGLIIKGVK